MVTEVATWPEDLEAAVSAGQRIVAGGVELDGPEIVALDRQAIRDFVAMVRDEAEAIAITSVFAPVSDRHECAARDIVTELAPGLPVVLSSKMGTIGLLERENSTVLNASLVGLVTEVTRSFQATLRDLGLTARCYVAQNDGTLMNLERAHDFPVLAIGSGLANSVRGAAHQSGLTDAIQCGVRPRGHGRNPRPTRRAMRRGVGSVAAPRRTAGVAGGALLLASAAVALVG